MDVRRIRPGVFFTPRSDLPRGRYALDREAVVAAQRERLMAAFTELVAANGLASVTVGDIVGRAGVSRAAFYGCFDDLTGCADAACERFIVVLQIRLAQAVDPTAEWHGLVESAVGAFLEALQADVVVARAMLLEMDAAGEATRARRRIALHELADAIAARHADLREEDPSVGPLPFEAHVGTVHGVWRLACDALEGAHEPDLLALADPVVRWVSASVLGAAHVGAVR